MATDNRRTILIIGISRGIGRGLTTECLTFPNDRAVVRATPTPR